MSQPGKKSTKEKILDKSIELFSNKGFHGVSIREIARAVGIKESSIYNHFSSKDNILESIFELFKHEMEATRPSDDALMQIIGEGSVEDFWRRGLVDFTQRTQTTRMEQISRIILYEMFRDERARDLAISELFTRQQETVRRVFGLMREQGMVGEVDLDVVSTAYSYAMLGLQMEWNLKKSWGLDLGLVEGRMLGHIGFVSGVVSV